MSFQIESGWDTLVDFFVGSNNPLEVPIPVCEACRQQIRDRQHRGGMVGMRTGAFLTCGLATLLALSEGWRDGSLLVVIGLGALAVGGISGFILGTLLSKRLPAELSRYSPSRGTLALRFRHPEYAARVLAAMRSPQREPL